MEVASRIAVTSRSFSKNLTLRHELQQRYPQTTFNDAGSSLSGKALVEFLKGHSKAIVALETIDESVLREVPDLKVISKYGVGLDKLDLTAMKKFGVKLGWRGGVNKRSVSELALSFAISLMHRVPVANLEARSGQWRQTIGNLLSQKTVGIVGVGHVGKDLISLLTPFGCRLLVHDILDLKEYCASVGALQVDLDELLKEADVISLHIPLTEKTKNLLSIQKLSLMKNSAVLINTARGGIVDEDALKKMLLGGRLAGAAFDVFAQEPPTDLELLNLPNFWVTPHIGGSAEEAILAMGRSAIVGLDEAIETDRYELACP